ncbi:unnamed protein product [Sphagnum compactum]
MVDVENVLEVELEGMKFSKTLIVPSTSSSPTLFLAGYGVTEMSIETIEVKFTAIGVYLEQTVVEHLKPWKGKTTVELLEEDSGFHKDLIQAPVEKLVKVAIIKGVKGTPYGGSLRSSLQDRLVYDDKFEEAEEATLDALATFFQPHTFPKGSTIFYHWPTPSIVQVSIAADGLVAAATVSHTIENKQVAEALLDVYLGENTITPSTLASVAEGISALL